MPICEHCKLEFNVGESDKSFYKKMDVPPPTFCKKCREKRRWSFRNEHTLYQRQCDKCKKMMVSMYSPDKPYVVYCKECYNSDEFDPLKYGRNFDFNRPFFEQFDELWRATPLVCIMGGANSVNSDYVSCEENDKNCYMNVGGHSNEDCYFNDFCMKSRNCVDNYWIFECELMYESVDCKNCYHSAYCQNCAACDNCMFCYNLRNCRDCVGCANLRGQQYVIFNKQYGKEEYEKKFRELTDGFKAIEETRKQFELAKKTHFRKFANHDKVENSTGDYLTECKNVFESFDIEKGEDLEWLQRSDDVKDSVDVGAVSCSQLLYEYVGGGWIYNGKFCALCFPKLSFLEYCAFCRNSDNLFGCVSIKKGRYNIFNKQYSEEEYKVLKKKIIDHMRKTGEYGEFFPFSLSPFGYNETVAQSLFPIEKEEALKMGYKWQDKLTSTFGKETIKFDDVPNRIEKTSDSILKEIFACAKCRRNFKIMEQEFQFYKQMKLPLPRFCPMCRYLGRLAIRNGRELYKRQCMCEQGSHGHSGRCTHEFMTTYEPGRPEIIYCEECYNREMY